MPSGIQDELWLLCTQCFATMAFMYHDNRFSDERRLLCIQCFAIMPTMYHAQWIVRRAMSALHTALCTHANHVACQWNVTRDTAHLHSGLHSCQSCTMPNGISDELRLLCTQCFATMSSMYHASDFQTSYDCFAHSGLQSCQPCAAPSGFSDEL